jgi:type IX secretion system PorP/SprF family membrane protein
MEKKFFIITLLSLIGLLQATPTAHAQDAEFSQFYAAPAYLNPAMIGFSGQPRFGLNYRHQYPTFGNAYMTLAASFDQHFSDFNSSIGASIVADFSGSGGIYNTYGINALYAYQLSLNQTMQLKIGAQVGYLGKSLNWDKVILYDMIDPTTGKPIIPTGESSPENLAVHRLDIGLGALIYNETFYAGASFKHVTQPNVSFYDNDDSENNVSLRSMVHIGKVFYLDTKKTFGNSFYISPNLLFVTQGKFKQINAGTYIGKGIIYGGLWLRHTLSNSDAIIALIGVKSGTLKIGYSYDFNIAGLNTSAGSHELSFLLDLGDNPRTKKQEKSRKATQCPEIF